MYRFLYNKQQRALGEARRPHSWRPRISWIRAFAKDWMRAASSIVSINLIHLARFTACCLRVETLLNAAIFAAHLFEWRCLHGR